MRIVATPPRGLCPLDVAKRQRAMAVLNRPAQDQSAGHHDANGS
jgi:hypothetical protein